MRAKLMLWGAAVAAALSSSVAVASVVVSIWEGACDRKVLAAELGTGYAVTEQALDDGKLIDATLEVEAPIPHRRAA